jgi:hypothetical protein
MIVPGRLRHAMKWPDTARYSKREGKPVDIEMTWLSIEADVRSPGELRCLSRRRPRHAREPLELRIVVGPGAMARSGDFWLVEI